MKYAVLLPLSLAEELELQAHYEREAVRACKALGFDRAIVGSAAVLLKRFFVRAAPTEHRPKAVV